MRTIEEIKQTLCDVMILNPDIDLDSIVSQAKAMVPIRKPLIEESVRRDKHICELIDRYRNSVNGNTAISIVHRLFKRTKIYTLGITIDHANSIVYRERGEFNWIYNTIDNIQLDFINHELFKIQYYDDVYYCPYCSYIDGSERSGRFYDIFSDKERAACDLYHNIVNRFDPHAVNSFGDLKDPVLLGMVNNLKSISHDNPYMVYPCERHAALRQPRVLNITSKQSINKTSEFLNKLRLASAINTYANTEK